MNARMLGITCALLAAMPNLVGCESSRNQDYQFEKQIKRAQECRQLQDKLVGDQPLTPAAQIITVGSQHENGAEVRADAEGLGATVSTRAGISANTSILAGEEPMVE